MQFNYSMLNYKTNIYVGTTRLPDNNNCWKIEHKNVKQTVEDTRIHTLSMLTKM